MGKKSIGPLLEITCKDKSHILDSRWSCSVLQSMPVTMYCEILMKTVYRMLLFCNLCGNNRRKYMWRINMKYGRNDQIGDNLCRKDYFTEIVYLFSYLTVKWA